MKLDAPVLTAAAVREPRPEPGRPRWHVHRLNRPAAYFTAAAAAATLPRRARLRVAAVLGAALSQRFAAERRVVAQNMVRIAPDATAAARAALVVAVFRHFAMCFVDLLVANRRPGAAARLVGRVEGVQHLDAAAAAGGGVVLVTAHLGNWELAGRLLAARLGRPTHVVVEAEADARLERFLRGRPAPVRFIRRGTPTAAVALVGALRRGEVVAMQGDRALGTRGDVAVPFFGAPAPFPLGPFLLARAVRAPLVPAFCTLDGDRRYAVDIGAPIDVAREGERAALARWVRVLETQVRARPEQWFNFYDVWSAAPAP